MNRFAALVVVCGFAGVLCAASTAAAPRLPSSDEEVLEKLPLKLSDPAAREIDRLRQSTAKGDPTAAVELARRNFQLAMAKGDPRFVGYGEAALLAAKPSPTSADAKVVQAMLRQYRHQFDSALQLLDDALRLDPGNAEAHGWRAAIFMVRADYDGARRECESLAKVGSELIATGCRSHLAGATGRSRDGYEKLRSALVRRPDIPGGLRLWSETRLAELADRFGEPRAAERHFKAALAADVEDNYALAAYADFLLDNSRPGEVLTLLAGRENSDTLLLRMALAASKLGLTVSTRYNQMLAERFSESALRGERLHLAEEARFLLDLENRPKDALAAAVENWKTQREPRDAEILLEAALAVGDPAAAGPALTWLRASGYEGRRARELAVRLASLKK